MSPTRPRGKALWLSACLIALVAAGCAPAPKVAPFEQGQDRYRFSFVLTRASGETGGCAASVSVKDLAANRTLAVPLFTAPWGARAEAAATDSAYGARLTASVTVSADGTKGECRAELYRGDALIASRESSVPVTVTLRSSKIKYR